MGFPPIAGDGVRILILGSLPGQRSLDAQQYYAHPQNVFWRIMKVLTGADGNYENRCRALIDNGIAVWDVLGASVRPGSMDADIRMKSAEANDFAGFFAKYPDIDMVCFNGMKAAQLFRKLVVLDMNIVPSHHATLPSTSPAFASMSFDDKLAAWRNAVTS